MVCKTNGPLPVNVEAGTQYSWCQCGLSREMPLCDHSHRNGSDKKSFKFVAEETKTMLLCGCASTTTPPLCDNIQCVTNIQNSNF